MVFSQGCWSRKSSRGEGTFKLRPEGWIRQSWRRQAFQEWTGLFRCRLACQNNPWKQKKYSLWSLAFMFLRVKFISSERSKPYFHAWSWTCSPMCKKGVVAESVWQWLTEQEAPTSYPANLWWHKCMQNKAVGILYWECAGMQQMFL